jgi:hypothetical protein
MAEIPTEALEAAARGHLLAAVSQATGHTVGCICQQCEDLTAAAPYLIAEGRRQRDAELFAPAPDTPVDDETPALMARYERELRAKIADEIRAELDDFPSAALSASSTAVAKSAVEWAARVVEAGSSTQREV